MAEFIVIKYDFIELVGPTSDRFERCRTINLTKFLPDYLKQSDTLDLVQFFEDYLNEMYDGSCGYQISTSAINEADNGISS